MNTEIQQRAEVVSQAVDMASIQVFTASMLALGAFIVLIATLLIVCNRKRSGLALLAMYGATTFVIPSFFATVAGILIATIAISGLGYEFVMGKKEAA